MAGAEHPLKKRKLCENLAETSPPVPLLSRPLLPPPQVVVKPPQPALPPTPLQLSHDEIMLRRRNQEEIRNVYICYNRINFCISQKDKHLKPDLERAYLSLITSSRGCSSVQRLAAEFIPKYASYCPTALEAAVKVLINMHNWSLGVISTGEDANGITFDIAKACIFGLVDICVSAAAATPMSSVIQGISMTVFCDAVTFFISSFEGKNISQIVDKEILKSEDVLGSVSQYEQKVLALDESCLLKLSKFRALSLLRIIFACTKNVIATCFDLFDSKDTHKEGYHFLRQLTERIDQASPHSLDDEYNGSTLSTSSIKKSCSGKDCSDDGFATGSKTTPKHTKEVSKNCLLGLVLDNDLSLKKLIISRYKKLHKPGFSQTVSLIASILEEVFDSFLDQVTVKEIKEEGEDDLCSREHNNKFMLPGACSQGHASEVSRSSIVSQLADRGSNTDGLCSRSLTVDSKEHGDLLHHRSGELFNEPVSSPIIRPSHSRSFSIDSGNCSSPIEKSHIPNMDHHPLPALRTSCGGAVCTTPSPKQRFPLHQPSINQVAWYCDGDPACLDIYPASKQLWVGSLDHNVAEGFLRLQFENIGPLDNFSYFPLKGFALVEFRYIRDAVKARDVMRRGSPWGTSLCVKFFDAGFGTRGAINGVTIGSSCHVYIGNVQNQWVKDEIIREARQMVIKGHVMVTDLCSEAALLMEFETPEEAAMVMNHLRQCRNSKNSSPRPLNAGLVNATMHVEGSRLGSTYYANNMVVQSPHAQAMVEQQTNAHMTSQPGMHHVLVSAKPENGFAEDASPRTKPEHGAVTASGHHGFQSNWRPIVGQGGGISGNGDQMWAHVKPERELHSGPTQGPTMGPPISIQGPPVASPLPVQTSPSASLHRVPVGSPHAPPHPHHTHLVLPPQSIQQPTIPPSQPVQSAFFRPGYFPPSGWDAHASNHTFPPNPSPSSSIHQNALVPPYLSASVTPLSQTQVSSAAPHNHIVYMNNQPSLTSFPAPHPEFRYPFTHQPVFHPAFHSSPPHPAPPIAPPPPNSPPPPPPPPSSGSLNSENSTQWQGTLNKSGVHYCNVYAQRVESVVCNYSSSVAEPTEWPALLDMTKRTDFEHVKSTFSSTPA
ncbi:unnamed protein product [Cuscuta europaea]|uniref:RRM domain-containing protein n=1 Tax=Cuscuta europaea TaxID=41803 RepID=A0A9P1E3T5_CUSEU|nr:unnamed protein product [Cuscuta europaea]